MTTAAISVAPEPEQSPALRGFERVRDANAWNVIHLLVDALDRGDDVRVQRLMKFLRWYATGPPPRDPDDTYTTYTWEEWQAEYGSGVTASDAPDGETQ